MFQTLSSNENHASSEEIGFDDIERSLKEINEILSRLLPKSKTKEVMEHLSEVTMDYHVEHRNSATGQEIAKLMPPKMCKDKTIALSRTWTMPSVTPFLSNQISEELKLSQFPESPSSVDTSMNEFADHLDDISVMRDTKTPQLSPSRTFESNVDLTQTPESSSFTNIVNAFELDANAGDADASDANIVDTNSGDAITVDAVALLEKDVSMGAVTAVTSIKEHKPIRRSITTIISHIGTSVKNVLKKKKQQIKSSFSVNSNLAGKSAKSIKRLSENSLKTLKKCKNDNCETRINKDDTEISSKSSELKSANSELTITKEKSSAESILDANKVLIEKETEEAHNQQIRDSYGLLLKYERLSRIPEQESPFKKFKSEDLYRIDGANPYDKIQVLIEKQSKQYQAYFAAEGKMDVVKIDQEIQTPYQAAIQITSSKAKASKIASSKTEGFINDLSDSVPYVCIGESSSAASRAQPTIEVDDFKTYKKSTSVLSNIKDYDLQWQTHFHQNQNNRSKLEMTLKCISLNLYNIIKKNHEEGKFICETVFNECCDDDEEMHELGPEEEPMIDATDIYEQLAYVFATGELNTEHAVLIHIYIMRMLEYSNQCIWDFTWRIILMCSVVTVIKTFDDAAVFNSDLAVLFPVMDISDVNRAEKKFLELLKWDVYVTCSQFARAYFYLRELQHSVNDQDI